RRSAPSSAGAPPERAGFCVLLFVWRVGSVFCIFASLVLLVGCFFIQPPILFAGRQENHLQFQLLAGHSPWRAEFRWPACELGQTGLVGRDGGRVDFSVSSHGCLVLFCVYCSTRGKSMNV